MRYFFYGTLLDPDVRRVVLGTSAAPDGLPARLHGFRRTCMAGTNVPALVAGDGWVDGRVFDNIGVVQRRRLIAFEGADYREIEQIVSVETGTAIRVRLFAPRRILRFTAEWSLDEWQETDKPAFVKRIGATAVRRRPAG